MKSARKTYEWITNQGVSEWRDNTWNYITPIGIFSALPDYEGKYVIHKTQEEVNALALTLVRLVKERKVPQIKYKFEGSYTHPDYKDEQPPILFYCRHKERSSIGRILDSLGLSDRRWIEQNSIKDIYQKQRAN